MIQRWMYSGAAVLLSLLIIAGLQMALSGDRSAEKRLQSQSEAVRLGRARAEAQARLAATQLEQARALEKELLPAAEFPGGFFELVRQAEQASGGQATDITFQESSALGGYLRRQIGLRVEYPDPSRLQPFLTALEEAPYLVRATSINADYPLGGKAGSASLTLYLYTRP